MRQISEPSISSAPTFNIKPKRIKSVALQHLLRDKVTLVALIILLLIILTTLGSDLVAGNFLGQSRDTIDLPLLSRETRLPPFPARVGGHILGTDDLARDVLVISEKLVVRKRVKL